MDREELLTTDELAEHYKVPKSWVYNQTKYRGPGCMPRLRMGKYLRFRLSDVEQWLEQKTAESMEI